MRLLFAIILVPLMLSMGACTGPETRVSPPKTGSDLMYSCQDRGPGEPKEDLHLYRQCVEALWTYVEHTRSELNSFHDICIPEGIEGESLRKSVVTHAMLNPERLNMDGTAFMTDTYGTIWPCKPNPRQLALEQWYACSHFPSIELVETTEEGSLVVREKTFSGLPVSYERCVSTVTFSQVKREIRPAGDSVWAAYFTDEFPTGVVYPGGLGRMPRTAEKFSAQGSLYFMFFIYYTGGAFESHVQWYNPGGEMVWSEREKSDDRGLKSVHKGYYYISPLPHGEIRETGTWRVDLLINHVHAGTFTVILE